MKYFGDQECAHRLESGDYLGLYESKHEIWAPILYTEKWVPLY